jgi:fucose permease
MCVVAFLPTYVQAAMGRGVTFAGAAIATQSVAWSVGAIVAARVMTMTSYKATGIAGALMLISGTALLVALNRDSAFGWLATAALLVGLGMGFCNQTFLLTMQGTVGWSERGVATASYLFSRTIGQSVGASIGGALLNYGIARNVPDAGDALERLLDPGRRAGLGADLVVRLGDAIASALHDVYIIALILAVMALTASLLLPARLTPAVTQAGRNENS